MGVRQSKYLFPAQGISSSQQRDHIRVFLRSKTKAKCEDALIRPGVSTGFILGIEPSRGSEQEMWALLGWDPAYAVALFMAGLLQGFLDYLPGSFLVGLQAWI